MGEQGGNSIQVVHYPRDQDENLVANYLQLRAEGQQVRWLKDIPEFEAAGKMSRTFHDDRHYGLSTYLFVDSHAKAMKHGQTFKMDGSYTMWTISNKWVVSLYSCR